MVGRGDSVGVDSITRALSFFGAGRGAGLSRVGESIGGCFGSGRRLDLRIDHLDAKSFILRRADTRVDIVLLNRAGHIGVIPSLSRPHSADITGSGIVVISHAGFLDIHLAVEVLDGQSNLILVSEVDQLGLQV